MVDTQAKPAMLTDQDIVELRKLHIHCDDTCYTRRMLVTFDAVVERADTAERELATAPAVLTRKEIDSLRHTLTAVYNGYPLEDWEITFIHPGSGRRVEPITFTPARLFATLDAGGG